MTPRRRGRPQSPTTQQVSVRVPDAVYDRLREFARERGVTVPHVFRIALTRARLPKRPDTDEDPDDADD